MNYVNVLLFGSTSRLGFLFLKSLSKKDKLNIIAFIRPCPDNELSRKNRNVFDEQITSYKAIHYEADDDLLVKVNEQISAFKGQKIVLVNLSTYDYLNVVHVCQDTGIPSFAIGSGAVIDWSAKRMNMNGYIEKKLRSEREYTTTVHPGFYLEDTGKDSPFSWSGLHTETYSWIFQKQFDKEMSWGKEKFMTSMSGLIELIKKWTQLITDDDINKKLPLFNRHFAFGTGRAYPRWFLRKCSGLPVEERIEHEHPFGNYYSEEMRKTKEAFKINLFHEEAFETSCKTAREWAECHSEELSAFVKLSQE